MLKQNALRDSNIDVLAAILSKLPTAELLNVAQVETVTILRGAERPANMLTPFSVLSRCQNVLLQLVR